MNAQQRNRIARNWAAAILLGTDWQCLEAIAGIGVDDPDKIVHQVHKIAGSILKKGKVYREFSLPDICRAVLADK